MAPRLETVTEEFCGWPYFEKYIFTQPKKNKPRAKKVAKLAPPKKPRRRKATLEVI